MTMTHPRILLVEDDASHVQLLEQVLGGAGYEVHAQASGAAALTHAAEHRPALVILDLRLPDLHGHQVCRELRKLYPKADLPVLMLTAVDQPVHKLRGYAHGADAYLTKPFELTELLQTVKLLLGQAQA